MTQDNLKILIERRIGTLDSVIPNQNPKPVPPPNPTAGYSRSPRPSSMIQYVSDSTGPTIQWKADWPPYETTIAIAKRYAEKHSIIADWSQLANLPFTVRSNDPSRVIWHYSKGGDAADAVIESYLIEAGFLQVVCS